jgi:hypothetical protein
MSEKGKAEHLKWIIDSFLKTEGRMCMQKGYDGGVYFVVMMRMMENEVEPRIAALRRPSLVLVHVDLPRVQVERC